MRYLLAQASAHRIPLRDQTVQCVVTSPPYWGLRAYAGEQRFVWGDDADHAHEWATEQPRKQTGGVGKSTLDSASWGNGMTPEAAIRSQQRQQALPDETASCVCGAWYGALGLEPTPQIYVQHMVEVFREVWRVLRNDGTLWLNLGDSYAASRSGPVGASGLQGDKRHNQEESRRAKDAAGRPNSRWGFEPWGIKPKSLVGIPWRVALALQEDGWTLRSEIIWNKPNPMPESVTDRPTKSHETVFLFSKRERYYFDGDAIAEPVAPLSIARVEQNGGHPVHNGERDRGYPGSPQTLDIESIRRSTLSGMRNVRTVWTIATQPYPGAHFATFPEGLPARCIKAGSCAGSVVLDPFNGSGTTGRVAMRLGRRYVGLDLSREYLTEQAIGRVDPLAAARRAFNAGEAAQAVLL